MNWNTNKPTKEGKYIAFVKNNRAPQFLNFDNEYPNGPFWHRAGLNQEVEVEYWIENPYEEYKEQSTTAPTPKDEKEEILTEETAVEPETTEVEIAETEQSEQDQEEKPAKRKGGRPKKTE